MVIILKINRVKNMKSLTKISLISSLSVTILLSGGCQTLHNWYQASVCNMGAAKEQGFNDARYGRGFAANYGSGCDNQKDVPSFRHAYELSYSLGMQQRRLDLKQQEYAVQQKQIDEIERLRRDRQLHPTPPPRRPGSNDKIIIINNNNN